jgi:hypothetical protein
MDFLEDYVLAFEHALRKAKVPTQYHWDTHEFWRMGLYIGSTYDEFEGLIETALKKRDYDSFFTHYKAAVDHLDQQSLEIRNARKGLFSKDVTDRMCDLDLELSRCDDMIDWDVVEPELGHMPEEKKKNRGKKKGGKMKETVV